MEYKDLYALALHAAKGTVPKAEYTSENVNDAFVAGLQELAGDYTSFMENRYKIYALIGQVADEVMPKRVLDTMGQFAEVRQVGNNEKVYYKRRIGKQRAKQFLTNVGLSGVYETFRLDNETFTVPTHAIGFGVTTDFERVLDGAETMAEVMDIMQQGLTDAVLLEIQKAMRAAFNAKKRPAANKYTSNTFNASEMVKLMNVVRAYGNGVVIFATPEFISAMGPDALVAGSTNFQGIYHPGDIDAIHNTGFVSIFRGAPIVQIPQSFVDENNDTVWIDPQIAYILPTGGEKVVKVTLEGDTIIKDFVNRDNSVEIMGYKKMGCAILTHHNWAIYKNTGITTPTMSQPYGI